MSTHVPIGHLADELGINSKQLGELLPMFPEPKMGGLYDVTGCRRLAEAILADDRDVEAQRFDQEAKQLDDARRRLADLQRSGRQQAHDVGEALRLQRTIRAMEEKQLGAAQKNLFDPVAAKSERDKLASELELLTRVSQRKPLDDADSKQLSAMGLTGPSGEIKPTPAALRMRVVQRELAGIDTRLNQ